VGHFISEQVVSKIEECDFLLADISILNFNVTYEIGYAIGKGKRVLLVKNSSIRELGLSIRDVGIFDTIGYSTYENSDQLSSFIDAAKTVNPLKIPNKINSRSPVYL
ncbi:nucleoside 2-deoxyribosyltransferase, partial [Vibrio anguillarum]